ncbi:PRC and DUF2382 domain-containing protein [Kitasatospora cathayae]|uniref:PRC and DUF2382 domain-containing protein n=1 Tax=Kitasatospora cathayae TaxID=3004092 RepID=A0ABY7PZ21_9ACTN|nr:PRC and DUF2382 domain-containing protein [Kitasatospora sp. HUAS 3-15]WBP85665.1 PRC and DUF2382 domain-containing protein [Kitasatospora sp. HUAS 3-15]
MQTDIDPRDLIGHKAVDRNGDKIGTVDEVYLDDATGQPEWAAVRTGIFGRDAFVPLTTSEFSGDELRVPYDKSLVKDSPDFGVGQHLSPAQELQLYRYYGLDTPADGRPASGEPGRATQPDLDFGSTSAAAATKPPAFRSPEPRPATTTTATSPDPATEANVRTPNTPTPAATGNTATAGTPSPTPTVELNRRPAPAPAPATTAPAPTTTAPAPTTPAPATTAPATTAPAPAGTAAASTPTGPVEITCREERLDITSEWHVVGTAKLRKYVTSEQVERRVSVRRERVRVERVPVNDAERVSLTEKEIAETVEEVALREERPVVRKYLVPIERVRLVVERYTAEEVVRDELRREHVEVHDSTPTATTPPGSAAEPIANGSRSSLRPLT